MSAPRTLEEVLLAPVREEIERALAELGLDVDHAVQLELLEAVACRIAGFDIDDYRALGGGTDFVDSVALPAPHRASPPPSRRRCVPPPLALTALAREPLEHSERRQGGCYYTDFRLARFLAERAVELKPCSGGDLVIDPASGTGILLAATALAAFGGGRKRSTTSCATRPAPRDLSLPHCAASPSRSPRSPATSTRSRRSATASAPVTASVGS